MKKSNLPQSKSAKISLLVFMIVFLASFSVDLQSKGNLTIVGGALSSENQDVYRAFIADASKNGKPIIGIVPAASGSPYTNAMRFRRNLMKYGVDSTRIFILPLAVKDDERTKNVDESTWANNATNPELIHDINRCTGIWFIGGDQSRITEVLYMQDSLPTPALEAIENRFKDGMALGGSSAGAAIMSDPMIAGGNSYGALSNPVGYSFQSMDQQESGQLILKKGLGFFTFGIVDQHFDRKARLARLIVAMDEKEERFGFGIDENTAIHVVPDSGYFRVLGEGTVTIVRFFDRPEKKVFAGLKKYQGVDISLLSHNDQYNYQTGEFNIYPTKTNVAGKEYYSIEKPVVSGVLSPNSEYKNLVFYLLVDNSKADEAMSYCFEDETKGFRLRFYKDETTLGYYGNSKGSEMYSALHVKMDIIPVQLSIKPFE